MPLKPPYKPRKVSDIEIAFPAHVDRLMPEWTHDIGEEWERNPDSATWRKFQHDWMFGPFRGANICMRDDIDPEEAMRHLTAIQRSYEPKHEAKIYAVSFLASRWFQYVSDKDGNILYGTEAPEPADS